MKALDPALNTRIWSRRQCCDSSQVRDGDPGKLCRASRRLRSSLAASSRDTDELIFVHLLNAAPHLHDVPVHAQVFTNSVRRRLHFLGFVCEKEYRPGEITEMAYYLPNMNLFTDEDEARNAFLTFPLCPTSSP